MSLELTQQYFYVLFGILFQNNVLKSACSMNVIEYTPVTSAESLLGDGMLLPGNGSQPTEMSCNEYLTYVDELLHNISQQVCTVVKSLPHLFYI